MEGQPQPPQPGPPRGGPMPQRRVLPEEVKEFHVIYPQYLDATLTPADGRRLTKTQSVDVPTCQEIVAALQQLGFKEIAFDPRKSYPRSQGTARFPIPPRGCVRVRVKEPASAHYVKKSDFDTQTRACVVPGLESKHQVLVKVAELIKQRGGERPSMPTVTELLAATTPNQPKTVKK